MPWWLSATARTIARPRPEEPERSPWARKKRSKTFSCSSVGMPGPVVLDREHDVAVGALDRRLHGRAGVGVAQRVLHQVEHEPVQLVLHAVDLGALDRVDRDLVVARHRLELGGGRGHDVGEVDDAARRLAPRVGAREQQQVGDQAAHPPARAQRGRGGLPVLAVQRLLEQLEVRQHRRQRRAQLVRGVGDELALAHQGGLGLRRAPRRARAASIPASWPARRPRRRPPGAGSSATRCACARSRAPRRSARRSAPSRAARSPGRRAAPARRRRARRGRGTASRG